MSASSSQEKPKTLRQIVEDTLTVQRTQFLWTANYFPALPFTPHDFQIGALLPAMLYMARFGHRRGKGKFVATFGAHANIADVAKTLLARPESALAGFESVAGPEVLGDLLLASCLENRAHELGQNEQVQRVFPSHYLASWLDLPDKVVDLRGVPEFLTALLADQPKGEWLEIGLARGRFPVGVTFSENILLALFGQAMNVSGPYATNLASDDFDEKVAQNIGIEELLAVRLAQACGSAPNQAQGKDETKQIPNRHPLARHAAKFLREDLAIFIEIYGASVPRQAFLQMLEAGIALGLTSLLLSTVKVLEDWEQNGQIPNTQPPWPLFVDCSNGQDNKLRDLAENSMVECIRRYEQLPVRMMLLRVLDDKARRDRKLSASQLPAITPDATEWINLLGEIYHERHPRAEPILDALHDDCTRLSESLADQSPEVAARLGQNNVSPALRCAEAICELMGDVSQYQHFIKAMESVFITNQPNGLVIKRRVQRSKNGNKQQMDRRAVVLNPPLLDFLVHRHLRQSTKGKPRQPLSLQTFLRLLRERYGLYIDQEPPGQSISQPLLLNNKARLERRLRDLGLLIGVNDAESMKQLQPRYSGTKND